MPKKKVFKKVGASLQRTKLTDFPSWDVLEKEQRGPLQDDMEKLNSGLRVSDSLKANSQRNRNKMAEGGLQARA